MPNYLTFNSTSIRVKLYKYVLICSCLTVLVTVLSCANTPPSVTLPQAKVAASSIDHANYRAYVKDDVEGVLVKLMQAEEAAAGNEHKHAEQLAQQVLVEIELIKIKTQRLTVEEDVENIELSITSLHQELQWREPVTLSPLDY